MLNLVIFLVVFFAAISYAIHLLKQKQNTQPRPQRPKPANDDSFSWPAIFDADSGDSGHSHHHHGGHGHSGSDSGHHGGFDAGHSHGGFDSGHGGFDGGHGGFDGGGGHH